jgi:putative ATPase
MATLHACQNIGMPECRINLAHLVAYLRFVDEWCCVFPSYHDCSEAPKCTRAYEAYQRAEEAVNKDPALPVPLEMRNAPTSLMKEIGYGRSYHYNPQYAYAVNPACMKIRTDTPTNRHPVHNTYLPPQIEGQTFLKKFGDIEGKQWDEDALMTWETVCNGGKQWEGRA